MTDRTNRKGRRPQTPWTAYAHRGVLPSLASCALLACAPLLPAASPTGRLRPSRHPRDKSAGARPRCGVRRPHLLIRGGRLAVAADECEPSCVGPDRPSWTIEAVMP